jgi:hypothetical protein
MRGNKNKAKITENSVSALAVVGVISSTGTVGAGLSFCVFFGKSEDDKRKNSTPCLLWHVGGVDFV